MSYSLEPAFAVAPGLSRKLVLAGMNPENQWFFTNGYFNSEAGLIEHEPNTWLTENFVVIDEEVIIAYFHATWNKPLNIISGFRIILFEKNKAHIMVKAFFEYLDYLFVNRGCKVFNWIVAEKNIHAYKLYEKFINKYMGQKVGKRTRGQMSYSGEISDIYLYEITETEYFAWKGKNNGRKNKEIVEF